jgi:hypothetical protein
MEKTRKEKEIKPVSVKVTSDTLRQKFIDVNEKFKFQFLLNQEKNITKLQSEFYKDKKFVIYEPVKWSDVWKLFNKWEVQKNKSRTFLIYMERASGKHEQFTIKTEMDSFIFENKRYLIDEEYKFEDISAKLWCLRYHETLCLPVSSRIPANQLIRASEGQTAKIYDALIHHDDERVRKAMAEIPKNDIVFALNPENMERFLQSKIIEKVIKGSEMEDIFNFLKIMTIVNTVILGIMLLLIIVLVWNKG